MSKDQDGKYLLDRIAEKIVERCLEGDHKFVETLLERTEGKVNATFDINSAEIGRRLPRDRDGNPIEP